MSDSTESRVRADTHVHFHECFDEGRFLDAAAESLDAQATNEGQVSAVLCLTESQGADWFGRLSACSPDTSIGASAWQTAATREHNSILVRDKGGRCLAIVAGRQIVCAERLEVLALGLAEAYDDGEPIRTVLKDVADAGALPVLPWGFGKWTGDRGETMKQLLEDPPCEFAMGDNGGRLAVLGEPSLLATAKKKGYAVLPGTDPFPFAWDTGRVGSFGIEWDGYLDADTPFLGLKALVTEKAKHGVVFGQLESLPGFIRNQVAIQLRRVPGLLSR